MSKHVVQLVNYSIGITVSTVAVCGHSGKRYGYSRYSDTCQAHAIELSLEDYPAAIKDISRNWHKNRCRWIPYFVLADNIVTPQTSPELREIALGHARNLSTDDLQELLLVRDPHRLNSLPKTTGETGGGIEIQTGSGSFVSPVKMTEGFAPIPGNQSGTVLPDRYWSLIKIAKDEGTPVAGLKKITELQSAILEHRARKAA